MTGWAILRIFHNCYMPLRNMVGYLFPSSAKDTFPLEEDSVLLPWHNLALSPGSFPATLIMCPCLARPCTRPGWLYLLVRTVFDWSWFSSTFVLEVPCRISSFLSSTCIYWVPAILGVRHAVVWARQTWSLPLWSWHSVDSFVIPREQKFFSVGMMLLVCRFPLRRLRLLP